MFRPRFTPLDALHKLMRMLLLLLGIATNPYLASALQGGHCTGHVRVVHPAASHSGHTPEHGALPGSWDLPAHGDCPHCPASECDRQVPCASAVVFATLSHVVTLPDPAAEVGVAIPGSQRILSITLAPPTPPPQ